MPGTLAPFQSPLPADTAWAMRGKLNSNSWCRLPGSTATVDLAPTVSKSLSLSSCLIGCPNQCTLAPISARISADHLKGVTISSASEGKSLPCLSRRHDPGGTKYSTFQPCFLAYLANLILANPKSIAMK